MLTACAVDEEEMQPLKTKGYSFPARIAEFSEPDPNVDLLGEGELSFGTRVQITDEDDKWSVKRFENGDAIGFYSANGDVTAPDGNGPFVNVPMYFQRKSDGNGVFINNDIQYSTDYFVPRYSTFYYFPYHENIEYDATHTRLLDDDDYGIEIRKQDGGIDKCIDFMWVVSPSSATSSQTFNHAFSSIVFLRGQGFENASDKTIKVFLNKGVSHITLSKTDDYMRNMKLVYLEGYGKTEMECREWDAWEGDPYLVVDDKSQYYGDKYKDAYYIILPTTRGTERISVDHIELYDNDGNLKVVSDFNLYTSSANSTNSKILYYGQRYPLVIKMKGLETVVTPLSIKPWGEDVVIEEIRESGIVDENDFDQWSMTYSQYLASGRSADYDDALKSYGDKTESADGSTAKWTFYINNDLDLSILIGSHEPGILQYLLGTLDDTLDGLNHTITGLRLECQTPPSFIGELGNNGIVRNLKIRGLNVKCTDTTKSDPVGGIFGICRGTILNCDVDGVVAGYGPAGLFGGTGENAVIENCTASGLVIGASTAEGGLFGNSSNITLLDVISTGLIYTHY